MELTMDGYKLALGIAVAIVAVFVLVPSLSRRRTASPAPVFPPPVIVAPDPEERVWFELFGTVLASMMRHEHGKDFAIAAARTARTARGVADEALRVYLERWSARAPSAATTSATRPAPPRPQASVLITRGSDAGDASPSVSPAKPR